MKKGIIGIVCRLIALLFAYTAFSKLLAFNRFKSVLSSAPLIGKYPMLLAAFILAIELLSSLFLLFPQTQKTGLVTGTTQLMIFTAYLGFMELTNPHLPCSCSGVIQQLSRKQHIVFNFCFILLGIAVIFFKRNGATEKCDKSNYDSKKKYLLQ